MEAAYSEYISSNGAPDQPQAIVPSSSAPPLCATNVAVQDGSGAAARPDDVVIDIALPMDSGKTNSGNVDDSGVI
jgi:hypothetical protein